MRANNSSNPEQDDEIRQWEERRARGESTQPHEEQKHYRNARPGSVDRSSAGPRRKIRERERERVRTVNDEREIGRAHV